MYCLYYCSLFLDVDSSYCLFLHFSLRHSFPLSFLLDWSTSKGLSVFVFFSGNVLSYPLFWRIVLKYIEFVVDCYFSLALWKCHPIALSIWFLVWNQWVVLLRIFYQRNCPLLLSGFCVFGSWQFDYEVFHCGLHSVYLTRGLPNSLDT